MPSDPSAHAARNPAFRVQLARRRIGKSNAIKASDNLRLGQRVMSIATISAAYNKKPNMVRGILNSISQYQSTRAPSLRNAVVHQRAVNYQAEGETKTLKEIRDELQDDIDNGRFSLDTMDDEESARLIEDVLEHRKLKRKGARATAKAAQLDAKPNWRRDLHLRTGVCGIAFFSRGNVDDPSLPYIMDTDGAMEFLTVGLQITSLELVRNVILTHLAGNLEKNGVGDVRKDVSRCLQDGFRKITNNPNASMEYVHYDVAVREAKGVELAGFPTDVQIEKRAEWNVEMGRRIRSMLCSGAIHWVKMTKTQHDELIAEQNSKRAALGAGALRKRKERSDKGQKRGKHAKAAATGDPDDSDDGGENEKEVVRPTPRGARASLAPGVGSAVDNGSVTALAPSLPHTTAPALVHNVALAIPPPPVPNTTATQVPPTTAPLSPAPASASVADTAAAPLVPDAAALAASLVPGIAASTFPPIADAAVSALTIPSAAAAAPLFPDDAAIPHDTNLTIQLDPELIQLMNEMESYMPPLATAFDLTRATPAPSTPPFATLPPFNSSGPLTAVSTNTAPVASSKRKHGEGVSDEVRAALGKSGAASRKKPRQQNSGAGASHRGENVPPAPKPRKKRSDTGVPRGPKKSAASAA
ncbi:hypothetical protein B0H12DRAFT_1239404 [Mycena haematopus]|nr:hypothetical protein B0H12DRAFT_1239404 [Mycena haematopus]